LNLFLKREISSPKVLVLDFSLSKTPNELSIHVGVILWVMLEP